MNRLEIDQAWFLVFLSLLYRLFFAVATTTVFVPDEYFQTLEPAYNYSFGNGIRCGVIHAYSHRLLMHTRSTWEWNCPFRIRSFVSIIPYILSTFVASALVRLTLMQHPIAHDLSVFSSGYFFRHRNDHLRKMHAGSDIRRRRCVSPILMQVRTRTYLERLPSSRPLIYFRYPPK